MWAAQTATGMRPSRAHSGQKASQYIQPVAEEARSTTRSHAATSIARPIMGNAARLIRWLARSSLARQGVGHRPDQQRHAFQLHHHQRARDPRDWHPRRAAEVVYVLRV